MKKFIFIAMLLLLSISMSAQDNSAYLNYEGSVSTHMYLDRPSTLDNSSGIALHTSHGVRLLKDILYVGGSVEYVQEQYKSITYAAHVKCSYPIHTSVGAFVGFEIGSRTYLSTMNSDFIMVPAAGIRFRLSHSKALELSARAVFDMYHSTPIFGFGIGFCF